MSFIIDFRVGHLLDDGRMDHQTAQSHMAIYGANSALRNSSNSSSPGGGGSTVLGGVSHGHGGNPAALLVVPQPINATKIGASLTNGTGTGRKYQCKMCPQVTSLSQSILLSFLDRKLDSEPNRKRSQ